MNTSVTPIPKQSCREGTPVKYIKVVGAGFLAITIAIILSFLAGVPIYWLINYIFGSPDLAGIAAAFGGMCMFALLCILGLSWLDEHHYV